MEIDDIRNKWRQLDEHVKVQDEKIRELTDAVVAGKVKSPLSTLRRHCLLGIVLEPLMLPFFFWAYSFVGLQGTDSVKMLLRVMTIVFIGFTWIREIVLYVVLGRINVSRDSVLTSLRETIRFRKLYHYGVSIDLVLGLITVMLMFYCMNTAFIVGGIMGGVLGGIVGARLYRYYKRKIDELESSLQEWDDTDDQM